jgi:hypothetical protein
MLLSATADSGPRFAISTGGSSAEQILQGSTPLSADVWHHLALVLDTSNGQGRLLVDGETVAQGDIALSPADLGTTRSNWLGHGLDQSNWTGSIDEVRLWSTARDDAQIDRADRHLVSATQEGLAAYWRFDAGGGDRAYDYTRQGRHAILENTQWSAEVSPVRHCGTTDGNGDYSILGASYGLDATFVVSPDTSGGRTFSPTQTQVSLNSVSPFKDGIGFVDESSFSVSGQVLYAGTSCGVDSLDLIFRGQTFPSVATTDAQGRFDTGLQIGTYSANADFHGHTFDPDSLHLDVRTDISGLTILDTTRHTLSGKIVGGVCDVFLGQATVQITAPGACLDTTLTVEGTEYSIELPAQDYVVQVSLPDNPLIQFPTRSVSLLDSSQSADFVYRSAPQITVVGFPEARCEVPVMAQGLRYPLRISVEEVYGDNTCRADSGLVSVFDEIGDAAQPLEVELDSTGAFVYILNAGSPNILAGGRHPYQKRFQVEARTGGGNASLEQWAIVTGSRPREQTFVTVSPEVPLLILRDPPGDASFSYLEEGTTTCNTTGFSVLAEAGAKVYSETKAGHAFETGLEVFKVSYAEERSFWGTVGESFEVVGTVKNQSEHEMCITASSRFSTSDNPLVTGSDGDVFVGAALNMVYALTDVLEVDESCQVALSKSIMYSPNGFDTWYIYTENHIRNILIPDLENLAELEQDIDKRLEYLDQIDVWYQTLDLNQTLKDQAEPIGDDFNNISFSANARVENFTETTETSTSSIDFNLSLNYEISVEAGFDIAGKGARKGGSARVRLDIGSNSVDETTNTNRVGFVLFDDDPGDFFSVDIKADPTYGTPVFDLAAGESSAPWERGTLPREGVQISLDTQSRNDVDPDGQAAFRLALGNSSQSDESRTYEIAVLQESNPDGAVISIGGVVVERALSFTIPAGQVVETTLAVRRGPVAYDYENIRLVLRSPEDPVQIADTTSFTVRYESPCSSVSLLSPQPGWIANSGDGDSLIVALQDYDRESLSNIALQFSPAGRNTWRTSSLVPRGELADDQDLITWHFGSLDDGDYDLRAVVNCDAGVSYSSQATGLVDRQPPRLLGEAEPADGIWEPGDAITATFDEPLDCDTVTPPNTLLRLARSGEPVTAVFSCSADGVLVSPQAEAAEIEDEVLEVVLEGLADPSGNQAEQSVSWSFRANRNPVGWAPVVLNADVQPGQLQTLNSTLLNSGGRAANFELVEWPSWLTPDPQDGTLAAGASQRIQWTVAADIPLGLSEGQVVANTPAGPERMPVRVQARCPAPDWAVDTALFDSDMQVVATFYADGESVGDKNDLVAAFAGEQVRGVAQLQRIVPQDEFAGFLTVHGFAAADRPIELRLWDASECSVRQLTRTLVFLPDTTLGQAAQPDSLELSDSPVQRLLLEDTWNWISLRLETLDMSLENLTSRLAPRDGDLIKDQTGFSQFVAGQGWIGNLDSLKSGAAYKVRLNDDDERDREWVVVGDPVPPQRPLDLHPGWNWIGYLPAAPSPVNQALAGLPSASGDVIKDLGNFSSFDGDAWIGNLTTLAPGQGYLLKRSTAGALAYPAAAAKIAADDQAAWQVDRTAYEHSMNLIAVLGVEGVASTNPALELGVFAADSCRGVASPVFVLGQWQYYLTIYGDTTGEELDIRGLDTETGQEWAIDQTVAFGVDSVVGTPERPLILSATEQHRAIASGDFDNDGQVGFADFFIFSDFFGKPAEGPGRAYDLDGDGQIGLGDFFLFAERFETTPTAKAIKQDLAWADNRLNAESNINGGQLRLSLDLEHFDGLSGYGLLLRYDPQQTRYLQGQAASQGGTLLAHPLRPGLLLVAYTRPHSKGPAPTELLFTTTDGSSEMAVEEAYLRQQDGQVLRLAADLPDTPLPNQSALGANYPNPFNPQTVLPYQIGSAGPVRLEIYDVLGQKIRTLVNTPQQRGHYRAVWNGRDDQGRRLGSGVYLSRLATGDGVAVKRLLLLK